MTFKSLNQPADYRELKGKDPSSIELLQKIDQVHTKLQVTAFKMVHPETFQRFISPKISHNDGFMSPISTASV